LIANSTASTITAGEASVNLPEITPLSVLVLTPVSMVSARHRELDREQHGEHDRREIGQPARNRARAQK